MSSTMGKARRIGEMVQALRYFKRNEKIFKDNNKLRPLTLNNERRALSDKTDVFK